ncbi:MAG: flagellar export chaperone FlgN [Planctomycetota bacterium]|nr:flagellar export chaperone FlgN [Planctomycetota bacterium]
MTTPADSYRNVQACVQEVMEGLDQQCALLETLRQLASSQGPLIEASEHDSLLEVVRKRQELVDRLDTTRTGMSTAIHQLQEDLDDMPQDVRVGLRARIAKVQKLVDQVAEIDAKDANQLKQHQATCRERLERLTATTTARQGYRTATKPDARFADAKG